MKTKTDKKELVSQLNAPLEWTFIELLTADVAHIDCNQYEHQLGLEDWIPVKSECGHYE